MTQLQLPIVEVGVNDHIAQIEITKGNKHTYEGFKLNHPDSPG